MVKSLPHVAAWGDRPIARIPAQLVADFAQSRRGRGRRLLYAAKSAFQFRGVVLMDRAELIDTIEDLFRRKGTSLYGGEAVTQTEHALQAAMLAEDSGASSAQIAAALLHDI